MNLTDLLTTGTIVLGAIIFILYRIKTTRASNKNACATACGHCGSNSKCSTKVFTIKQNDKTQSSIGD